MSVYFQGKKDGKISVPVNIANLDKKESVIKAFPNPFENEVNVYFENDYNDEVSIEMYNILGQRAIAEYQQKDNNQIIIQTSSLSSGMYYLKVMVGNEIHTIKIVRQ